MSSDEIQSLKKSFSEDGYIFLPGFLSKEEMQILKDRLKIFIENGLKSMEPNHYFYEDANDPTTLKQMQDLEKYDEWFAAMSLNEKFAGLASALLGEEVDCKTVEYFNKPPRIGKATPPHQDGYYFMIQPQQAVTMWLALEEVDEANGCVKYVKGSHKKEMRRHGRTTTLGFSQGIVDFPTPEDLQNEVAFPANPGDLLVHHSLTIHRAGPNTTADRTRKAMGLIYFGKSAKEDVEAKEKYKKQLVGENAGN